MNDHSSTNGSHSDFQPTTLDEVLAECVRNVEQGSIASRAELLSRYPNWADDIIEFFSNWEEMEKFSAELSAQRRALDDKAKPGSNIRYFGDYELIEETGHGGMGVIYKARQMSLDRIVAVKMILNPRHDRQRFRVEAEAAASLDHPNIVSIYEIGEYEDHPYFSMQFIDGVNLGNGIENGELDPRIAARITSSIARAVHYAHQRGVLHRDLKPANVLLDASGKPHVTDFGLAKQLRQEEGITETGAILGTPGYMAPEQAAGGTKQHTTATDVYGVGAILYALLVGHAPFKGQYPVDVLRHVTDRVPDPPRKTRPAIHRDLETICLKCLEKEPAARYRSAEHLADDLDRYLRNEPIAARYVGSLERTWRWCRRNPLIASLSGATAMLMVAIAIVSSLLASRERSARIAAEKGGLRESSLREEIHRGYEKEKVARNDAVGALVDSFATRGFVAGQRFDSGEALLWFAKAAELADSDPVRRRANAITYASWLQSNPKPVGAWWIKDTEVLDTTFHLAGDRLLVATSIGHFVWHINSDQHWALNELHPEISVSSWHPDGTSIVVGDDDGNVVVIDVVRQQVIQKSKLSNPIHCLTYTTDGNQIAIGAGRHARIWDWQQNGFSEFESAHPAAIEFMTFNDAGDRLIILCGDRKARLFDVNDSSSPICQSTCVLETTSEFRQAFRPEFVGDGRHWMVKSSENSIDFIDSVSGNTVRSIGTGVTWAFVASPDGKRFINAGETYARVRNRNGTRHRQLLVHGQRITTLDVHPNSDAIVSGGWDRNVRLWQMTEAKPYDATINERKRPLASIPHATRLKRVLFSPDGDRLLTLQIDGLIRVWEIPNLRAGGYRVSLPGRGSYAQIIDSQHWMETGTSQTSGTLEELNVRRMDSGEKVGSPIKVDGQLIDAQHSPRGDQIATLSAPRNRNNETMFSSDGSAGQLSLWNWPDGSPVGDDLPMPSEPRSISYHPSGDIVAVHCAGGQVFVVNALSGAVLHQLDTVDVRLEAKFHYNNGMIRFDPTGRFLVAWRRNDGLWIWDVQRFGMADSLVAQLNTPVREVDFSRDGSRMALACGSDLIVQVVKTRTGELASAPIPHPTVVFTARFDASEDRLVTTCRDGQTRVFDWRTGEPQLRGLNHDKDAVDATFTPDGRYLLTIGLENIVRVWDANEGRLVLKPFEVRGRPRRVLISPDSRHAIICGQVSEVYVLNLGQLHQANILLNQKDYLLSELLSNQTIHEGGTIQLSTAEWLERWRKYSALVDANR